MDIEFLDPGPDQPDGPAAGTQREPAPFESPKRETIGLLIMLAAAAILPLVASFQNLYTVREDAGGGEVEFAVDAWGRYGLATGGPLLAHAPRFGLPLMACSAGFALLALVTALRLLPGRAPEPARTAALVAGLAAGLVGLLTGVTAAMALEIQSVFDTLRSNGGLRIGGPLEIRLRIGGAVWMSLAGILAGGLSVTAALRVRRLPRPAPPLPVAVDTPPWRPSSPRPGTDGC